VQTRAWGKEGGGGRGKKLNRGKYKNAQRKKKRTRASTAIHYTFLDRVGFLYASEHCKVKGQGAEDLKMG